jgi:hypothetical protein
MPFQNMSGDPEQEYFADGMLEEIITALSRIGWLIVIARNSTFTYKGEAIDVNQGPPNPAAGARLHGFTSPRDLVADQGPITICADTAPESVICAEMHAMQRTYEDPGAKWGPP